MNTRDLQAGDPATWSALAERVRSAVIQAGIAAYEDASLQGLCAEGAWEASTAAMRRVDLRQLWSASDE